MDRDLLKDCTLCPRNCHVDRLSGKKGYCGVTGALYVARAALHMWEEPCISGRNGSGTVFFSGCSLGCVYCQNHHIARAKSGREITTERLSEIFLELEGKGAHNINLVTPSHYALHIMDAIDRARAKGLRLPIVYNCSGYEKTDALKRLEGYVDIYLPDFKYMDRGLAAKYSNCPDYSKHASEALKEMLRQTGEARFDRDGIMQKGVLVRHLMLPGYLEDSKRILEYLYGTFGNQIWISIMSQYTPMPEVRAFPEINRKVGAKEYEELVDYAIMLGIEQGFIQEGDTALESFIPEFNGEGV